MIKKYGMKKTELAKKIKDGYVFVDGGMGTLLQDKGLEPGEFPERWNIIHPEIITEVHKSYLAAGCNIVTANTFGANILKFEEDELKQIIFAAVENAKKACTKEDQYVALDIGPTGKLLKPLGDLEFEKAVEIFAASVCIGTEAGADLIIIETMNDSYEMKASVLAAKENSDLPICATNAYDGSGKLVTGATPKAMVALLEGLGVDALGVNCSLGPEEMMPVVKELTKYASLPVIVSPNAGLPRVQDGRTVYDVGPQEFAESMTKIAGLGARILGGCCGTTPEHIARMINAVSTTTPKPLSEKNITLVSSYTHAVEFGIRPILIGERINPTGKKKLQNSLINHEMEYILNQAILQEEAKADILDVNVGLPEINEPELMEDLVKEIQAVSALPLQIDTSSSKAMERALRCYNGKAMVNSVNGKNEVMEEIFPLVKKYGGVVIGLLLDENGIPETTEGRFKIAEKIYKKAAEYGISKKNIILDPLAMTISTNEMAAKTVLETIRHISNELGGLTSLGVSNISFGLPERSLLNSSFLLMAMEEGLSAAIINPLSLEMMEAYFSFLALSGLDANCGKYIDFATRMALAQNHSILSRNAAFSQNQDSSHPALFSSDDKERTRERTGDDELKYAVIKGLKEQAGKITDKLLKEGDDPLSIIDKKLIPALNDVGKSYEEKTIFLPQLLMSSEAAKAAFSVLRDYMAQKGMGSKKKGKFVIATVKGDIHDIGKNIVKAILENYDFEVFDLGKDVPPELVMETVVREHAPIVGLSALMTTTVPSMEETIRMLKKDAPWCKTIVGGAVLNQKYADMIGADYYAKDAMETVRIAEEILKVQ